MTVCEAITYVRRIPQFKDFILHSGLGELMSFMLSGPCVFYHDHVLIKEPYASRLTPWHHDQPYYPVNGDMVSTALCFVLAVLKQL